MKMSTISPQPADVIIAMDQQSTTAAAAATTTTTTTTTATSPATLRNQPVTLSWENLSYSVTTGKGKNQQQKLLLNGVGGTTDARAITFH